MEKKFVKKLRVNSKFYKLEVSESFLTIQHGNNNVVKGSSTKKFGSNPEAEIEFGKMINILVSQGFQEKIESDSGEIVVYDKAKWHINEDFPKNLDHKQAYVHTGMFLKWVMKNRLFSSQLSSNFQKQISSVDEEKIKGSEFYREVLDGVFTAEDLNSVGIEFANQYFEFENGKFLSDYEQVLAYNLPSIFDVKETAENYQLLADVIDQRFSQWNEQF